MTHRFLSMLIAGLMLAGIGCKDADEEAELEAKKADSLRKIANSPTTYQKITMDRDPKNLSISRLRGYRVQIFTGQDRDEAQRVKALFMKYFPNVDNYLEYEVPNYKVRVGDFLYRSKAEELKKEINKVRVAQLEGSFVVKCLVNAVLPPPPVDTVPDDQIVYYTLIDSTGKEIKVPVLKQSLSKQEVDSLERENKKPAVAPPPANPQNPTQRVITKDSVH